MTRPSAAALVAAIAIALARPVRAAETVSSPPVAGGVAADSSAVDPDDAEPIEPPTDTDDGVDVEIEAADSIEAGAMEVEVGATGHDGSANLQRRRVRFQDRDLSADAREGAGDPLAGAVFRGRAFTIGRFTPRWGRGLVAGVPEDPWRARWGVTSPAPRARSLEGVAVRKGPLELFAGRQSKRGLGGARLVRGAASLGVFANAHGPLLASLALDREDQSAEVAMDPAGRWRAESRLVRQVGEAQLVARVRGGLPRLGAPADPKRSTPAQALTLVATRPWSGARASMLGAWWRFRPGRVGSRGALAVERELSHHQRLAIGLEEQQGTRREIPRALDGIRQGVWSEWRGGPPGLGLALRNEIWGEGPWVRREVRRSSLAAVELAGPAGSTVRITHGVFRVRSGESLYLAEAESDRLVLRAFTGSGERTRLDVTAPLADGRARATVGMTATAGRPPRLQWTVDWTRRLSTRRTSPRAGPTRGGGSNPEEDG